MTLGERLRQLRGGRTLRDVATQCHIQISTLSRMENGRLVFSFYNLVELAAVYNVTLMEMFNGVDFDEVGTPDVLPFDER